MIAAASVIRNFFSVILLDISGPLPLRSSVRLIQSIHLKCFIFAPEEPNGLSKPKVATRLNHTGRGRCCLVKRSIGQQVRNRRANHIFVDVWNPLEGGV
jgi:hypothetical protein